MSNYCPLQIKTHYSLLKSCITPEKLAVFLEKHGFKAAAITDYGTISGCVNFYKAMAAKKIKPILGCTLYICSGPSTEKTPENRPLSYLTVLCKNLAAWKELIKIVSFSNDPVRWDGRPRLSLDDLAGFDLSNFICITGGQASVLANEIFNEKRVAYNLVTDVKLHRYGDWATRVRNKGNKLKEMFLDNLYLEMDRGITDFSAQDLLNDLWEKTGPRVAAPNAHYLKPEDATDQRVLLCTYLKKELKDVARDVVNFDEHTLGQFFLSDKFSLPTELGQPYTPEEIAATVEIANQCEEYDILSGARLPEFKTPSGQKPNEYLRELCREGWSKKIAKKIPKEKQQEYVDRIKHELDILEEADLSSYFLILVDIMNWTRLQGYLCGYGRGSSSGCLTSYLIGITAVDPIKHGLYFERFWNASRKGSMPDIDIDIPQKSRPYVIQYIKDKYGENSVSQMITYSNLKGRSALKEVLRCYGGVSYTEMNEITEPIPQEQAIAGDLQDMLEEEGSSSIIKWALENRPTELKAWCFIEDGELKGPLSKRFEQAIRLENIRKAQSKHAAGLVISPGRMDDFCPMIYDKSEDGLVAGYEMKDIESIGLVKYDLLGLSTLDRVMMTKDLLYDRK